MSAGMIIIMMIMITIDIMKMLTGLSSQLILFYFFKFGAKWGLRGQGPGNPRAVYSAKSDPVICLKKKRKYQGNKLIKAALKRLL